MYMDIKYIYPASFTLNLIIDVVGINTFDLFINVYTKLYSEKLCNSKVR